MKVATVDIVGTAELPTYGCLGNAYIEEMKSEGKPPQSVKNITPVINSWLRWLNLTKESKIGAELFHDFQKSLVCYEKHQRHSGIKYNTYKSRISILKSVRRFAFSKVEEQQLPKNFSERLRFLLGVKGISARYLANSLGTGFERGDRIHRWLRGAIPRPYNYKEIEKIETFFEVSPGTLLETLPLRNKNHTEVQPEIGFRTRQKRAVGEIYTKWNLVAEQEFQDLVDYKTMTIPPEGLKRHKKSTWVKHEDGEVPTADMFKNCLASFFGYCCLSKDSANPCLRGSGMEEDSITIALVTDISLLEGFISFRKDRADGKYNYWHLTFISKITSLLSKETGYLYQKPEFAKKLKMPITKKQWQKRCLSTRNRLLEVASGISEAEKNGNIDFAYSRDPSEPIQDILKQKNPLDITLKMIEDLIEDAEKYPKNSIRKAIIYRNALLLAILQANPLRARMFSIMELGKNLIKEDGAWWIRFDRKEFKNSKNLKTNYTARLADEIYFIIEGYLTEFRTRILGETESNRVFVALIENHNRHEKRRLSVRAISAIVSDYTRKYIKDSPSFGPNAFRHIVATSIIKNDPLQGFYLAAKALNNRVETVEKNYAHLKTSELFEPYNDFFKANWNKVVKSLNAQTDNEEK